MRITTLSVFAIALVACKSDPPDNGPNDKGDDTDTEVEEITIDPADVELNGVCDAEELFGGFSISHFSQDPQFQYAAVQGQVTDGVVPVTVLQPIIEVESCILLKRNLPPLCEPQCESDEACDLDGECIPYPQGQDLGTVTVDGLTVPVSMEPLIPGFTYFDPEVPYPAYEEGDVIVLETEGGVYDPITMYGVGGADLVINESEWIVFAGQDMPITWNAPSPDLPTRTHIWVRMNIDQHGLTPIQLFCEFEDDGAASIPAVALDELLGAGVSGFANATATRRTVDSGPAGDGCMELIVQSSYSPDILVDGHIACSGPGQCPPGMTCDVPTGTCEPD